MKKIIFFVCFVFLPFFASAQSQIAVDIGISDSINMGEIGPSPIFKNTFTTGDRFRFENGIEFSPMDKYTKAGWIVANQVDFMVFPFGYGFFVLGSADYRHRNGGQWAKDGVRIGAGLGYEKADTQFRFSVKQKVVSLNDNINYSPYFELLLRGDYPLGNSNWGLRAETEAGFFKYIQNSNRRTAFYSNVSIGFVYKWKIRP